MDAQKNSENACLGVYSFIDGTIYCDTGLGPVPISSPYDWSLEDWRFFEIDQPEDPTVIKVQPRSVSTSELSSLLID